MILLPLTLITISTASANQKVVTGFDCEVGSSSTKEWKWTRYGPNGGANGGSGSSSGSEGRLFEFDCQTSRCWDSENERGHWWVTCGYSWKYAEDLDDTERVIVDVKTEASNSYGSCEHSHYARALNIDSEGWRAIDSQGDEGHWGFHFCYKLAYWSDVKASSTAIVTDLTSSTSSSVSGFTKIGQWDTEDNGSAKAYGNGGTTRGWLYMFQQKAQPEVPSYATVIGQWTFVSVSRPLTSDSEYTVTKHVESSEHDEIATSEMRNWGNQISEAHNVEVAVQGSVSYGASSASAEARYGYSYEHTKSEQFENQLQNIASNTFTQSQTVEHTFTIPKQVEGEPKYSNIWYFKTDIIESTFETAAHYQVQSGIEVHGCGYHLPPNCLPGFCSPYDSHCWTCSEDYAIIDPEFVPPPECGGPNEGCGWFAVPLSECPTDDISDSLAECSEDMFDGELCEADTTLPDGQEANIDNCGSYDVFRFLC